MSKKKPNSMYFSFFGNCYSTFYNLIKRENGMEKEESEETTWMFLPIIYYHFILLANLIESRLVSQMSAICTTSLTAS
jgi:hypothetical protein